MTRCSYPDPDLGQGQTRLRPWREDDLECIRLAATDASIPTGTTVPARFSEEEGRAFVRRQWGRLTDNQGVSLAIVDAATDDAVGLAVVLLRPQQRVAGLGYWVVPPARGHGRATTAVRLLSRWALASWDLQRVEAWVAPHNEPSQRTLLAAGFQREGVLRNFLERGTEAAVVFSLIPSDLA